MTVVTPYFTFPSIRWWMQVVHADTVIFDASEHFEKMTDRNRYHICGANNSVLLSIPLVNGRNQHIPMNTVQIHNADRWQTQHWRTLVSVYKRSPYFWHYENSLQALFERPFTNLVDFNKVALDWVKKELKLNYKDEQAANYIKQYPPEIVDLRKTGKTGEEVIVPKYHQVFEDRIGFIPNLSILDLLFSEGPHAINRLR